MAGVMCFSVNTIIFICLFSICLHPSDSNYRVSFGRSVLITLRFKVPETERTNGTLMHLLSNCCIGCPGRPGPTIDIAVLTDTTGGVIVLSTYSSASGEKFIFIPYSNTVRYYYH